MKQVLRNSLVLLLMVPGLALAHTGVGQTTGFMHGLAHPVSGMDHLLAMVAVGLWAAQIGGRALWAVPATFVTVMLFGGLLGFSGFPLPFIEGGILLSVLVLGLLIAGAVKVPLAYSATIVAVFALFHGYAHGAEMPVAAESLTYSLGFALATAMLHLAGMALGLLVQRSNLAALSRFAGGAIALGGAYLAFA